MDDTHKNWGDPKHFSYFSQHRVDLAQEVKKHPVLLELLNNHPQEEFEILIAEISSYCEVVLDGDYTSLDLDGLCKVLYDKLVFKRVGIQVVRDPTVDYSKGGH